MRRLSPSVFSLDSECKFFFLFIKILFCIIGFCEIVVISSFCRERWNRFEMCLTILDEVHVLESCLCSILVYVVEIDECESCLCSIHVLESCLLLFSQY